MKISVSTILGLLCGAGLGWGQAVPSQIASVQSGNNGNSHSSSGTIQLRYQNQGQNQSQKAYVQFDLSGFPNLTPGGIQKATLVLYAESGGNPGTISICQVSQAWSASSITGINAPPCTNTPMVTFSVSEAQLQQGSFVVVDITSIVQSWYNGSPNYGIMLCPEAGVGNGNSGVNVQFDSLQGSSGYPPLLDFVLQGGGATGPQGPAGPVGPQGPAGVAGPAGPAGAVGPQGPAGLTGATGPQGPIGLTGATGPQGPIGLTGATGPQGPAGAIGPQGPAGVAGPAGAAGPQGPIGNTGATGPQGAPGPPGATGATGATGPAGAAGAPGQLQVASVIITDEQLRSLGDVPVTLVPAQGPGTLIVPVSLVAVVYPSSPGVGPTYTCFCSVRQLLGPVNLGDQTFFNGFVGQTMPVIVMTAGVFGDAAAMINQPFTIATVNEFDGSPLSATGTGGGMKVTLYYTLLNP